MSNQPNLERSSAVTEPSDSGGGPTFVICARCGQYNWPTEPKCLFCGEPIRSLENGVRYCERCGQALPLAASQCPRCGASLPRLELPAAPAELGLWARVGYILLIVLGALMVLSGLGYGLWLVFAGGAVGGGALAVTLVGVGAFFIWQSASALNQARRQGMLSGPPSLSASRDLSMWVWLGLLAMVWGLGSLVVLIAPNLIAWTMPFLIALAALLSSLVFFAATLHGLRVPAGRPPLHARLEPRYAINLASALSATFSTSLSIVFEAVAMAVVAGLMLAAAYLIGDQALYQRLLGMADNMAILDELETMIASSPVVLVGLGNLLVVCAPLIEECLKGLPLLFFARRRAILTERLSILLGVAGGVGFAFAENIGYLSALVEEWPLMLWFRTGAAVMHGVASGFIGRAWYRAVGQRRWSGAFFDLLKGLGVHAGWNALALLVGWFGYKGMQEGVMFTILVGLMPLAALFTVLARWGIWVSEKGEMHG